jgi:hypothetical protein
LEEVYTTPPRGPRWVYVISDGNRHTWSGLQGHAVVKKIAAAKETQFSQACGVPNFRAIV